MTRKDFNAIATAIHRNRPKHIDDNWASLIIDIANVCAATNPDFDHNRFTIACYDGLNAKVGR